MSVPPAPGTPIPSVHDVSAHSYPTELREAEAAAVRTRRHKAGIALATEHTDASSLPPDALGVALSGGGIRSATFGLGVLQAMAARRWARRIDFLSTVSGGGYIGSFWCAWVNRLRGAAEGRPPPASVQGRLGRDLAEAEAKLADSTSAPVAWLRENGRYLTPSGSGDAWLAATVLQRNFVAVQLFAVAGLSMMFYCLALVWTLPALFTPHFLLAPFYFAFGPLRVAGLGAYWTLTAALITVYIALGVAYFVVPSQQEDTRNTVTRVQAFVGMLSLAIGGYTLVDTVAASVVATLAGMPRSLWWEAGRQVTAAVVAFGSFLAWSNKLRLSLIAESRKAKRPGLGGALLGLGASLLGAVWLVAVGALAHWLLPVIARHCGSSQVAGREGFQAVLPVRFEGGLAWVILLVPLVIWILPFVYRVLTKSSLTNRTALASLYQARLTRAYLGASNPARGDKADVTDTIEGDQVPFESYFPHAAGGPLHFVNITVNETLDPRSSVLRQDRKGVPMAVGPFGLTAGIRHHVLWETNGAGQRTGRVRAIGQPGFHLWRNRPATNAAATGAAENTRVELCTLGQWLAISGAAFTPGLGSRTRLPLSFLLTFFNVRLGWWWDSGVSPVRRAGQKLTWFRQITFVAARLFQFQTQLYAEFTARFPGTARTEWYLSDGGHFENTAAYELIRRRIPRIFVVDAGCDPERSAEDFGNLVRKARLDFQAEIEVLSSQELAAMKDDYPEVTRVFGSLDDVYRRWKKLRRSKAALIARVRYAGSERVSVLVLMKPTMRGNESAAERNYGVANPDFPQETTQDQFFDEAQWESYRCLGEEIGGDVLDAIRDDAFFERVAGR